MAKRTFSPPVTWLGRHTGWFNLGILTALGVFFRFWQLSSLPPGLSVSEAKVGLEAWNLATHAWLPGLTGANGYAPLWIWLQALPVKLLGPTTLSLRLWPALIGAAAVVMTWLWARDWFNRRVAWVAGFVVAVTPWAVTMSRNGLPVVLMLLLVPLTLWVAGWTYHRRNVRWSLLLAGVLVLDLLSGPLGWLLAVTVLGLGKVRLIQEHKLWGLERARLAGLTVVLAGVAGTGWLLATSWSQVQSGLKAAALVHDAASLGDGFMRMLFMFNLRGDENFLHNFGGEPLLNAFIGLMFAAGLLVSLTRLAQRRYQVLLVVLAALLLPVWLVLAGAPNAAHAAAALPLVAVLAAIGVSYMLELWYATFPINSAARSTGQAVIILLLILTLFQGYTQYFRAWAGSSETYAAYSEPAVAAARYLRDRHFAGPHYLVATPEEQTVVAYLNARMPYVPLTAAQVVGVPLGTGPQLFVITASSRDVVTHSLSLKFPGGTLKPHASTFSRNDIYYTYEVAK